MSADTIPEVRPQTARRFSERLSFLTDEAESVTAFDLVQALVGVCQAMDRCPVGQSDDREAHEMHNRRATGARLLAEQLEARTECSGTRREIRSGGAR